MSGRVRGPCRYFGAAKQLPGVKELFEKEAPKQVREWGLCMAVATADATL